MVNREYVTLSGDLPFKQNDEAVALGSTDVGVRPRVNVNAQNPTSESDSHFSKET